MIAQNLTELNLLLKKEAVAPRLIFPSDLHNFRKLAID